MSNPPQKLAVLKMVKLFIERYAHPGIPDQRCVETFIECEATEAVSSLRAELLQIVEDKVAETFLNAVVGRPRQMRHQTYAGWARAMLLWIAAPHQ